jgi:hypothetical protein
MGSGEANYKKLTKSLLGHFIKNQIPPKKTLA